MAGPLRGSSVSPADLSVPTSLWSLLKDKVPAHEHHEVKTLLGDSLVEQSEELHEEVQTLLEIWRDYRQESGPAVNVLAEPPAVRDRLRQEIAFFTQCLEERAIDNGRDPSKVMATHNQEIIDYATTMDNMSCSSGYNSRPSTAQSSRGSLRSMTPNTDRLPFQEDISAITEKLNIWRFDEVVTSLQDKLTEEISMLLSDVELIQGYLEDETDGDSSFERDREPTLTDLREERASLERHLLTSEYPVVVKPSRTPAKLRSLEPTPPHPSTGDDGRQYTQGRAPTSGLKLLVLRSMQLPAPHTHVTVQSAKPRPPGRKTPVTHVPAPPTVAKTRSTTSATRLRKMVLECREGKSFGF